MIDLLAEDRLKILATLTIERSPNSSRERRNPRVYLQMVASWYMTPLSLIGFGTAAVEPGEIPGCH
jgi:hypothetical protein